MTHTYINHPTKLGYIKFDSSTQPSGDIPKCLYMTEITIITSSFPCIVGLQIVYFHDLYIKWYMTFIIRNNNLNNTTIVIRNYHTPYMICTISIKIKNMYMSIIKWVMWIKQLYRSRNISIFMYHNANNALLEAYAPSEPVPAVNCQIWSLQISVRIIKASLIMDLLKILS